MSHTIETYHFKTHTRYLTIHKMREVCHKYPNKLNKPTSSSLSVKIIRLMIYHNLKENYNKTID